MFDEQTYDIDSRIKYYKGSPGDRTGVVGVDFVCDGRRIKKRITFEYPGRLEVAAINELTSFLQEVDNSN